MDRTNISILLATALLGVLLYVVRQIGQTGIEAVTPPAREPAPEVAAVESTRVVAAPQTTETALPVVDSTPALVTLLDSLGLDGRAALEGARAWYQQRGFIGANPLLGADPDSALLVYYASLDDATLEAMSANNDVGATHELANRLRLVDPFAAQKMLGRAVGQGSVKAMLQLASFQETLADVNPDDFASDPEYMRNLSRFGGRDPESNLRYAAYLNALTALRDGGLPVTDDALLSWVDELRARVPEGRWRQACNQSLTNFVGLSGARRAAGTAPMNVTPPPVFMTVAEGEDALPCQDTVNPIVSAMDLSGCGATEVVDGRGALRLLYVCTSN